MKTQKHDERQPTGDPTDAVVIPFPGTHRGSGKPRKTASPPLGPSVDHEPGALFEVPLRAAPAPRAAKPTSMPATKPKPAPSKPSRPVLRTAGPDHELCEGMKRTRRVRVTFEADVYEAKFYGDRLTIFLELPNGERLPITPEDIGALVEVIEKDGAK